MLCKYRESDMLRVSMMRGRVVLRLHRRLRLLIQYRSPHRVNSRMHERMNDEFKFASYRERPAYQAHHSAHQQGA